MALDAIRKQKHKKLPPREPEELALDPRASPCCLYRMGRRVQVGQAHPTPTASPLQLQPPQTAQELWLSLDSLVSPRTSCFQPWFHIKVI